MTTESPLKNFYLVENGLIRKLKLISRFWMSKPGKETTTLNIFPNISRSNGNQTMKFDQLKETRNSYFCVTPKNHCLFLTNILKSTVTKKVILCIYNLDEEKL